MRFANAFPRKIILEIADMKNSLADLMAERFGQPTEVGSAMAAPHAELQKLAAEAGRGPIPVSIFGVGSDPEHVKQYRDEGVSRIIFSVKPEGRDLVLARLDKLAKIAADIS